MVDPVFNDPIDPAGQMDPQLSAREFAVLAVGVAMQAIVPKSSLDATYTVSKALPDGVSLDADTGNITGTPTAASAFSFYTITATSAAGTRGINIELGVLNPVLVDTTGDTTGDCSAGTGTCSIRSALTYAHGITGQQVIVVPAGTYILANLALSGEEDPITGAGSDTTIIDSNNGSPGINVATGVS